MFKRIINVGISLGTPEPVARKARIVNLASLLTSGLLWFFVIVLSVRQLWAHTMLYAVLALVASAPILINARGQHTIARAVALLTVALILMALEFVMRSGSRDVFLVCLMLLGIFMAETRRESVLVFVGIAGLFIFKSHIPELIDTNGLPHESWIGSWVNLVVGSAGLVAIVDLFKTDGQRYEEQLAIINAELEAKRQEAEEQRKANERKASVFAAKNADAEMIHRDIQDSIRYASRIQKSMLLSKEQLRAHLPECLVFFKPKDVLSGDFYWFAETEGMLFLAVADCTGHGVPGAMMTVMGNNLLHQIVGRDGIRSPAAILTELDRRVAVLLGQRVQGNDSVTDGMDMALVRIDRQAGTVTFSGAKRPLFAFHGTGGDITEYPASRRSIGGQSPEGFHDTAVPYAPKDSFYLFSDGYADQFGPQGKFLVKRFRRLLMDIQRKPMPEQHRLLNETLLRWKVTEPQTDDIAVLGFRL